MSRGTQDTRQKSSALSPTGLSPSLAARSRDLRLDMRFVTSCELLQACCRPYNPGMHRPEAAKQLVWAFPRSLAATRGIISFPRGTKMFQFPRFPLPDLCVQSGVTRHDRAGFPHSGIPG